MYKNEITSELEKMSGKMTELSVEGFINSRIVFNKLKFEFIHDIIKLYDDSNNYFLFNINQIIKFCADQIVKIVTDNDITIFIKEKNAY